jgi:hypothetical protein
VLDARRPEVVALLETAAVVEYGKYPLDMFTADACWAG